MGQEINLLDRYPRSKRPIDERGAAIKPEHRAVARQFDRDYFDGERLHGYGGYHYHPRFWQETVKRLRDHFALPENASLLDVGCGKGFMMHDFKALMPGLTVQGLDISRYALDNAMEDMKPFIKLGDAKSLPFKDASFDLVISINTVHNLGLEDCKTALREIQRVGRGKSFVTMDAWRNEAERESLMKWNLTALTYMSTDDWKTLFQDIGYTGDYYWFIAE